MDIMKKHRWFFLLLNILSKLFWRKVLKQSKLSIILVYNMTTLILAFIFYPLLPILMNYPPNNEEVSRKLGTSNSLQYIVIVSFALIAGTIYLIRALRGLNKWETLNHNNEDDIKKINEIRKVCFNLPYTIFLGQILTINVPLIFVGMLVTSLNGSSHAIVIKVVIITFSLFSLAAVFSHTFSKRIFTRILLKTYIGGKKQGIRIRIGNKIFLQIIPMIMVAIIFTASMGYSRIIIEKGDLISNIYITKMGEALDKIDNIKEAKQVFDVLNTLKFEQSKTVYFVKTPEGKILTSDKSELGGYFIYYISNPYDGYRMFDLNAESQGVVLKAIEGNVDWRIGAIFEVASNKTLIYFIFGFFALLLLNIFVLYFLSKTLSSEISLVADGLTGIAEGESVDLDKKLAVTSNDEIGDLVIAFNKIQDREKEHILEIQEKQSILMEQERLASLGHLMGGIAHNLRSPIMSISGGIEGLRDLIKEYDVGIDDEEVNKADHHEIAKEMVVWIEKMKPYCSYMDDIITTVKGQTTHYEDRIGLGFTLDEVGKRVEILIEHELKRHHCKLKVNFTADKNTKINGEISVLIQILNNLIVNAAQAYLGNGGEIELTVLENEKDIEFIIKDYGCGINETVKKKLFKEMVTTKGNKGTGLGLYMSYSNLKARFGGRMRFESEVGKGTTFFINIPYK
jgi:signal transduction histidine kinase